MRTSVIMAGPGSQGSKVRMKELRLEVLVSAMATMSHRVLWMRSVVKVTIGSENTRYAGSRLYLCPHSTGHA
jgi:hypothetical protein